ncbi:MAG: VWA domain-containing protein [Candidatus Acidiferrales bacterium]
MNPRSIAVVAFALAATAGLCGQEVNSPPGLIRVTTKLVTVSVIVRDKHGQAVTDLTKNDFLLFDAKRPQPIQVFSMEKTQVIPATEQPLPPGTYSNQAVNAGGSPSNLTIILLDYLNTNFTDRAYPSGQVRKLLLTLHPEDRVALYAVGPGLRVLHDFTGDASSLLAALKDNKNTQLQDVDVVQPELSNAYNHQMEGLANQDVAIHSEQQAENRVAATAEALLAIADHVSYLPGRKNLIWISAAFPFYLESGNIQRTPDGKKLAYSTETELVERALTNAQIAVYPVDARGLISGGTDEISNKSPDKLAMDIAEFANMDALARRTGGRVYRDTNGITGAIRQTIDGSRVAYQLGFYPENVTWDGSFHKIQVKVNRRDVQVQARDGYFALAEPNLTPEMVRQMIAQAAYSLIDATGIRFTLRVPPASPGTRDKLSLSFLLDLSQFAFAPLNGEWKDAVDVAFIAMDANNHILQTTVMALPFKVDMETYQHLLKEGFSLTKNVTVPLGAAELRVIVYDEGNSQVGSVRVPLTR